MAKQRKQVYTKPQIEGMCLIHNALVKEQFPNCPRLEEKLEVGRRTILRHLAFMKERLNLPIEYDRKRGGYHYTRSVKEFPLLTMSDGEMFALLVAQQTMTQYGGTPFAGSLASALKKLALNNGQDIASRKEAASIHILGPQQADLENFEILQRAVKQRRPVEFSYRKHDHDQWKKRHVHAYHMPCDKGRWYLVGHDLDRNEMRTFSLSRLVDACIMEGQFERPKDFDPKEYFKDSFGIFKGQGNYDVEIEFDRWGADLLSPNQWHPSQQISKLPKGGVRMKLHLDSLEEVAIWLLGWGEHATVIAPVELRQRLAKSAQAIVRKYSE